MFRKLFLAAAVLIASAGAAHAQMPWQVQYVDPRSGFTISTGTPYYNGYYQYQQPYYNYYQTYQVPNQVCLPQQGYYYPQQQYYYQYQASPQYYWVRKKNGKLQRIRR